MGRGAEGHVRGTFVLGSLFAVKHSKASWLPVLAGRFRSRPTWSMGAVFGHETLPSPEPAGQTTGLPDTLVRGPESKGAREAAFQAARVAVPSVSYIPLPVPVRDGMVFDPVRSLGRFSMMGASMTQLWRFLALADNVRFRCTSKAVWRQALDLANAPMDVEWVVTVPTNWQGSRFPIRGLTYHIEPMDPVVTTKSRDSSSSTMDTEQPKLLASLEREAKTLVLCTGLRELCLRISTRDRWRIRSPLDVGALTTLCGLSLLDLQCDSNFELHGLSNLSHLTRLCSLAVSPWPRDQLPLLPSSVQKLSISLVDGSEPHLIEEGTLNCPLAYWLLPQLESLKLNCMLPPEDVQLLLVQPGLRALQCKTVVPSGYMAPHMLGPSSVTELDWSCWSGLLGPGIVVSGIRHLVLKSLDKAEFQCSSPCTAALETLDLECCHYFPSGFLAFVAWVLAGPTKHSLHTLRLLAPDAPGLPRHQIPRLSNLRRLCLSNMFRIPRLPGLVDLALVTRVPAGYHVAPYMIPDAYHETGSIRRLVEQLPSCAPNLQVLNLLGRLEKVSAEPLGRLRELRCFCIWPMDLKVQEDRLLDELLIVTRRLRPDEQEPVPKLRLICMNHSSPKAQRRWETLAADRGILVSSLLQPWSVRRANYTV